MASAHESAFPGPGANPPPHPGPVHKHHQKRGWGAFLKSAQKRRALPPGVTIILLGTKAAGKESPGCSKHGGFKMHFVHSSNGPFPSHDTTPAPLTPLFSAAEPSSQGFFISQTTGILKFPW